MHLSDVLSIEELIQTLAETVSCGGNLLVNVGPNKDGTIETVFEERLTQMGQWLKVSANLFLDLDAESVNSVQNLQVDQ